MLVVSCWVRNVISQGLRLLICSSAKQKQHSKLLLYTRGLQSIRPSPDSHVEILTPGVMILEHEALQK